MKKIIIGTLAATLLIGGSIGMSAYAQDDDIKVSAVQSKQLIGMKKAKEVALKKANGVVESVELKTKNNKTYYEVDIDANKNKEFEVKIDAYTAKVLSVKESTDDDDDNDRIISSKSIITEDQAIAIAKKQVSGEVIKLKLDSDDGRYEYELELRTKKGKFEITIDANTGKILEQEFDDDDDHDDFDDDDNDRDDD
ncbi:PepSY domain-containing protein [Psychrobacillus sp.]|uniref:PepSY domain-containing protein n=1 Tax=Psychrobacillus sp. TaxID=1871623 RepID=UPI0028BE59E6|nr:PepSY domain-containing protein [Psychrobacillus sp.]